MSAEAYKRAVEWAGHVCECERPDSGDGRFVCWLHEVLGAGPDTRESLLLANLESLASGQARGGGEPACPRCGGRGWTRPMAPAGEDARIPCACTQPTAQRQCSGCGKKLEHHDAVYCQADYLERIKEAQQAEDRLPAQREAVALADAAKLLLIDCYDVQAQDELGEAVAAFEKARGGV